MRNGDFREKVRHFSLDSREIRLSKSFGSKKESQSTRRGLRVGSGFKEF